MSRMSAWIAAAAIYREPRVLAVMFLGFASGLPLLLTASTLAIRLTESGVDLTTIGLFAMVGVPYSLKFLWAPLIDRLPLPVLRSEEHTSELQSLMRISYAVFCLKKKKNTNMQYHIHATTHT